MWGVDVLSAYELVDAPRLEVFVLPGHKRMTRAQAGGGERTLARSDLTEVDGVRVTTPSRTCLDLACRRGRGPALAAVDALVREHHLEVGRLATDLIGFRRRRGVVQAREIVSMADGRAESSGESFVRLALHDAGLPAPELQFWVEDAGRPRYRLDLAFPEVRLAVEYDGEAFHSDTAHRAHDVARREWLRRRGWTVVVVRKGDLTGARLDAWLAHVRLALRSRCHTVRPG